jgi:hypothetical protein
MYNRLFSINEIEKDDTLKMAFLMLILTFLLTFSAWMYGILVPNHSPFGIVRFLEVGCPQIFSSCQQSAFFQFSKGSGGRFVYAVLFVMLIYAGLAAYSNKWKVAHLLLLTCYLFKIVFAIFFTKYVDISDTYDLTMGAVLLLFVEKKQFIRLALVLLYTVPAIAMLLGADIVGYSQLHLTFDSAHIKLILVAMSFLPWLLYSKYNFLQRPVYIALIIFHILAMIALGFKYHILGLGGLLLFFTDIKKDDSSKT